MVYGLCNQLQATHAGASRSIHGSVLLAQSPPHRLHSDSHEAHFRDAGLRASFLGHTQILSRSAAPPATAVRYK